MTENQTWMTIGVWVLVFLVVLYLLVQEIRYSACMDSWMQNPYMTEALARQVCK